jgi:hypothetical protein
VALNEGIEWRSLKVSAISAKPKMGRLREGKGEEISDDDCR